MRGVHAGAFIQVILVDKRTVALVAVVAIIVIAAAVLIVVNQDDEEKNDAGETITVIDLAGREVQISTPVNRIVCGDAEAMSLIASIAGEDFRDKIVGYDSNLLSYYPDLTRMWEASGMDFSKITSVGSLQDMSFSWETVAALEPDVVFIPMWVYQYGMVSEDTAAKMSDAGISIVNLDLFVNALDADTMERNCEVLGKIFGNEDVASRVSDFYKVQIEAVDSKLSSVKEGQYAVCNEMIVHLDTYNNAANVGSKYLLGQRNLFESGTQISAEAFAASDADYVFMMAFNGFVSNVGWGATISEADIQSINESLSKRPGWAEAPAVANGKVVIYDQVYINTFENWFVYQLFAEQMFPEVYSILNPVGVLESFYKEFLPWVEFKGVWYFTTGGEIGSTA